jgi:hypothetical protein
MIDSTFEVEHQMRVSWHVVFDRRDGRVVNLHKFISSTDNEDEITTVKERQRMALEFAKWYCELSDLGVMQVSLDFCVEEGATYQVDVRTGELVKIMTRPSFREVVKMIRARKIGKEVIDLAPPALKQELSQDK